MGFACQNFIQLLFISLLLDHSACRLETLLVESILDSNISGARSGHSGVDHAVRTGRFRVAQLGRVQSACYSVLFAERHSFRDGVVRDGFFGAREVAAESDSVAGVECFARLGRGRERDGDDVAQLVLVGLDVPPDSFGRKRVRHLLGHLAEESIPILRSLWSSLIWNNNFWLFQNQLARICIILNLLA